MHLGSHVFDSQRRVVAGLCTLVGLLYGADPVWTQEPGRESGPTQENRAVPILAPREQVATDGYPSALDTRESSDSDRTRASGAHESNDAASKDGAASPGFDGPGPLNAEVSAALVSVSGLLSSFDPAQRTNAAIELELGNGATDDDERAAAKIATLWNGGAYDEAVGALRILEARGIPVAIGVSWKRPMPMGTGIAASTGDTRIGGSRVGASQVVVDGDPLFGTIFVAVRWQSVGASPGWSLNISTDHGATFSETYYWYGYTGPVVDLDMTTVKFASGQTTDGETWVAYIYDGTPEVVRACLFRSSDGMHVDDEVWSDIDAQPKREVAIDSYIMIEAECDPNGACKYHRRVPWATIDNRGILLIRDLGLHLWLARDAADGLDMSVDWYPSDEAMYGVVDRFVSYIGTEGGVRVVKNAAEAVDCTLDYHTGAHRVTTLGTDSVGSRVFCLFETQTENGQRIVSYESNNGGESWRVSMLPEPIPGAGDCVQPSVPAHFDAMGSADSAWGWGAVYAQMGNAYFTRYDWSTRRWAKPVRFSDQSCYHDGSLAIGFIPEAPEGEVYSLGLAYLHREFVPPGVPNNYPYFDRAPGPGGYCHARGPTSQDPSSGFISQVIIGTLSCSSSNSVIGYDDYSDRFAELARGSSYELSLTSTLGDALDRIAVWVDWDQDLDFDDSGEPIDVTGSPGAGPYTATITPPNDATLGATRMRIRLVNAVRPQPCGATSTGEVEDYTIIVSGYCGARSGCGQYISRVQVAGIDNSSACDGYNSYGIPVADMYIGDPHRITVTVANGYAGNSGSLWIDWNQDLDFYDAGESITLAGSPGAGPYTATIIPPAGAMTGQTRMRVRIHREVDEHDPCGNEGYGEVEDYAVMVRPSYCTAGGNCGQLFEDIAHMSRVQLGRIDQSSRCLDYSNFTAVSTPMSIGEDYRLTMTLSFADRSVSGGAWIDWNQDGDFDDPGESISLTGSPGAGPYTATVTPPGGAPFGAARMRLRVRDSSSTHAISPCGQAGLNERGEVEDYTVVVVDSVCPRVDENLDLNEFSAFAGCLAGPGELPGPPMPQCLPVCLVFDFDRDMDVDVADFAAFQGSFEGSP